MSSTELSTICYLSNLYPVKTKYPTDDKAFMSMIHDPGSLKQAIESFLSDFERRAKISHKQEAEYKDVIHCYLADEGEFPNGRVHALNGNICCKCNKQDCERFKICRPEFPKYPTDEVFRTAPVGIDYAPIAIVKDVEPIGLGKEAKVSDTEGEAKQEVEVKPDKKEEQGPLSANNSEIKKEQIAEATQSSNLWDNFVIVGQKDIIEAGIDERTLVNAGPGTGKTYTLIRKLAYMLANENVKPEEIMVLCYTRAAVAVVKEYLENAIDELGFDVENIELLDICSFDSLATQLILFIQAEEAEESYNLDNYSYDARMELATELLKKYPYVLSMTKHLIIDEVQDLVGLRAQFVLELLHTLPKESGFTVFGDSCQSLYDYQSIQNKNLMSSATFYQKLSDEFANLMFLAMDINHRQGDSLSGFADEYRKAILCESINDCSNAIDSLKNSTIPEINFDDIISELNGSVTAILTRTNAMAMYISQQLREKKIKHVLKTRSDRETPQYGDWIAGIFYDYEYATINRSEFIERFISIYDDKNESIAVEYWHALLDGQSDKSKTKYTVEELLQGLSKGKDKLLFSSFDDINTGNLIVSNVHQSKGCEFSNVIIDEDLLKPDLFSEVGLTSAEKNKALLDEYKIGYVAVTRAKSALKRIRFESQFIHRERIFSRRYKMRKFGRGSGCKVILEKIEIKDDFVPVSFAETIERQRYIQENIYSGMPVKILRYNANAEGNIFYKLIKYNDFSDEEMLADVTKEFKNELRYILCEMRDNKIAPSQIYPFLFPTAFKNLHIGRKTTCIASSIGAPAGVKKFGSIGIWTGLSVVGFAKASMGDK